MRCLVFTVIAVISLTAATGASSSEQPDGWHKGEILVDGYPVTYVYPEKPFFYVEPKKTAELDGEKFVDIAKIVYERPFFATWKPAAVYYQYFFWNVGSERPVDSTESLLSLYHRLNEDGRFATVEKRTLPSGDWVYISNEVREAYYQYHHSGYAIVIDSSYSNDIRKKTRQKYSDYLRTVAENFNSAEQP